MDTEDRWYVRFRGHTLGPLTAEQVKSSVRRKELGPEDKLASTSNPSWRALRAESEFFRYWESFTRPLPAELAPLPSPKILWQKKRAALPAAPIAQAGPAPIEQPEPVKAVKPSPAPVKAKAKAKPAKKTKPTRSTAKNHAKPVSRATASFAPLKPEADQSLVSDSPKAELAAAGPKLAEETLSLLEALRDWNRKEKESMAPEAPARVQIQPAPVPAERAALARPEFVDAVNPPARERGIELKLNLVISKQFIFIFGLVAVLAAAAVIYTLVEAKKMRGPADSRLPDPSSPTIELSPEDDPIPQLKAPTRPRRD